MTLPRLGKKDMVGSRKAVASGNFTRGYNLSTTGPPVSPTPGWVYLHPSHVDGGRTRALRNAQVRIHVAGEALGIYRRLRFCSHLDKSVVGLDWDSWLALGGQRGDSDLELEVVPSWNLRGLAGMDHPDPTVKVAVKIALVSLLLGLISVGLGVLGVVVD